MTKQRNIYVDFVDEVSQLAEEYIEAAYKAGFEEGWSACAAERIEKDGGDKDTSSSSH